MHHFDYRNGVLHAEGVDLAALAASVGTPFYCYSTATLERHYRVFAEAFADVKATVCYAMKANSNQSVLRTLSRLGAGADVVSGGELRRALAAGIPAGKIVFSGVGKTAAELRAALDHGIFCINVESEPELELLSQIATSLGRETRISVRVNPDVDARTHAKISTGKSENKFGIPISRAREVYARAARLPGIRVAGVDMHIGSQITDLQPLADAFALLADFVRTLRADGHVISHVDFGGGLGIPYHADRPAPPLPAAYADIVKRAVRDLDVELLFEPGRLIVGNAGILVTQVLYVKHGDAKNFVVIDAAMNDLIRPTLYEAHHDILPVRQPAADAPTMVADVVGPVCETGDYLALDRKLAEPKAGDLLSIMTAGAYGAVQACTYNTRALVPEVLVKGEQYAVVRPRIEVDALIALDRPAPWLD
ncbi:diaminopimelate decarboxylase [Bradyrhizobium sp. U87765 SZCCT0131]|uniref:diaminopimelate decarboxylase n=1 Tax=unclassified Bradyrhizobium TaxID=2631580 RepID=UPI001BA8789A|nr:MULTISPECIES: diaminopimelate decarboxylase [unclassified Bradyrhizobium]MBR1220727.1 diaminopimelate decarboxylase [Bradyrhizobium sp. U87765 SZCCT0131]MBR1260453.1 diaminopimelate decarboxylase [Bradyrhizobium sp. U87765 SZCCT0134]MBR1307298.1 diaminopimelate decarboxylase [Bradyrhizobium sp. U87765 SZCCT0110]MBR1321252.1 diaminopimelate decarboxylase [Bradyrhizobium sp. U87765 SZCCT0109]MBR1349565.1 diaminopimelate decarboxylase [Bradyrhizobium sp. U87765 SZCCT0048]